MKQSADNALQPGTTRRHKGRTIRRLASARCSGACYLTGSAETQTPASLLRKKPATRATRCKHADMAYGPKQYGLSICIRTHRASKAFLALMIPPRRELWHSNPRSTRDQQISQATCATGFLPQMQPLSPHHVFAFGRHHLAGHGSWTVEAVGGGLRQLRRRAPSEAA